jgi:hypothetical protein
MNEYANESLFIDSKVMNRVAFMCGDAPPVHGAVGENVG